MGVQRGVACFKRKGGMKKEGEADTPFRTMFHNLSKMYLEIALNILQVIIFALARLDCKKISFWKTLINVMVI